MRATRAPLRLLGTALTACALVNLLALPVLAQEAEQFDIQQLSAMNLDELLSIKVVTATKSETTVEESPSIMTVFTRDDMRRLGAQKLADLLHFVPGFFEVGGQLDRNFAIRGVHSATAQHFVILLDGVPTNDFLQSSATPEMFSLEYVERVEIIRGPGSAIYGASALMGVINLITRRGDEKNTVQGTALAGTGPSGRVSLTAGSASEKSRTFFSLTAWADEGTPYSVSGSEDVLYPRFGQNTFDGLQMGETLSQPRQHTPIRVDKHGPSGELFIKHEIGEHLTLRLNAAHNDRYLQRTYNQALVKADNELTPPRYVQQRLLLDLEARAGDRAKYGQFTVRPTLLVHTHDMSSPRIPKRYMDDPELERLGDRPAAALVYAWSGNDVLASLPLEYAIDLGNAGFVHDLAVTAGVQPEYRVAFDYSQTRCFAGADPSGSHSPYGNDVHCSEQAFFNEGLVVQPENGISRDSNKSHLGNGDEWRVGSFAQLSAKLPADIGMVLGARVDVHPKFGAQWSPRIALTASITKNLYVKAQYARAFIFPAFLYYAGSNEMADSIGNPNIRPQSIDTLEALIGLRMRKARIELNGFHNRVHDFITFDPQVNARTGQFFFTNQGDLSIVGGETSVTAQVVERYLDVVLTGAVHLPLQAHTDDQFIVDNKLGGPTKAPAYTMGLQAGSEPITGLKLGVSFLAAGAVQSAELPWTTFENIQGAGGRSFSSKDQGDYSTQTYLLNASANYQLNEHLGLTLIASNLLNRRLYRPGALVNPYLLPAIRVMGGLTLTY